MKVPLGGVIGCPVGHSRSPRLHGAWLREYGLAGHYVPLHVEPEDLENVLRTMPQMGFVGVNVTIPYKERALELADIVSPEARAIGAANTLQFVDGSIVADNTDGYGFMANLIECAPEWDPKSGPALVLGAGGAARAVLVALAGAGVSEIRLTNRTFNRAHVLAAELEAPITVVDWSDRAEAADGVALVVNTTSLGMQGQPLLDFPPSALQMGMVVTDLVYTPLETGLLRAARARGCTTVDGLGMLLHQAVPGFQRWFGRTPQVTQALRATVLAP